MQTNSSTYRGRFAPSPSGSLHFGSLIAAMASYLDARQHDGQWLVRIEDVDETRTVKGATDDILRTLDGLGFQWNDKIIYQSQRKERYAEALAELTRKGMTYPCSCSRTEINAIARRGIEGVIYPGTCKNHPVKADQPNSIRIRTEHQKINFQDRILGDQSLNLGKEAGDFVIRRADSYTAYQLAVVVDDEDQGITHVVRGADLLYSTPRQIYLQQLLGFRTLSYAHVPLALDEQGRKLSKQDDAHPVSLNNTLEALQQAWLFLGQQAFPELSSQEEFWQFAMDRWDMSLIH